MCWTPAKSKGFEVSSYYQALLGVCTQSFPWRNIWKQKVPSRVAFFVWAAALEKQLQLVGRENAAVGSRDLMFGNRAFSGGCCLLQG